MTAQTPEKLIYDDDVYWMATLPLDGYLKTNKDIKFAVTNTACWRGYYGTWEIIDNQLYLVELQGKIKGYENVNLSYVFPGRDFVFAKWFNGSIRIPHGRLLEYFHADFCSIFEKDLFMEFQNGVLINQYEIDNVEEYKAQLILEEQRKKDKILIDERNKKNVKLYNIITCCVAVIIFIISCIGLYRYYQVGTAVAKIMSVWIFAELIIIYASSIFEILVPPKFKPNNDVFTLLLGTNVLILFLIGVGLGIYYSFLMNTFWGNLIAYTLSLGIFILIFFVIRANLLNRNKVEILNNSSD